MWHRKVSAFSLIEMLVVLILSSIVTGAVYYAYLTVNSFQVSLSKKYAGLVSASNLGYRLRTDIENSGVTLKLDSGLQCIFPTGRAVTYFVHDRYLTRHQDALIDTFQIDIIEKQLLFEGKERSVAPVDEIILEGRMMGKDLRYHILKEYDATYAVQFIKRDSLP